MSLTVLFMGLTVSAYQNDRYSYGISSKESRQYSGAIYASISPVSTTFPRSFDCYVTDKTEFETLATKIGVFGTLVIDGTSYSNCYISDFGDIYEIVRGSGKYTYHIQFSQAVTDSQSDQVYANEETVHIYTNKYLAAGAPLDYVPILLRGLAYVNIAVENKGESENLVVELYGAHNLNGDGKYALFLAVLDNTTAGKSNGGNITGPPNYAFLHFENLDLVHSASIDFTISKVATRR